MNSYAAVIGRTPLLLLLFLSATSAACVFTTRVEPGLGVPTEASKKARAIEIRAAQITVTRRACQMADARPADARAQFKAAELTAFLLRAEDEAAARSTALAEVRPTLARLTNAGASCEGPQVAGEVYEAAGDRVAAAALFVRSARQCHDVDAALSAARVLRQDRRCPEATSLLAQTWPSSPQDKWIPMFDAIASCSTTVTLRKNLAFLPPDVVADYFAVLEDRQREAERRERERVAEETARKIDDERRDSRYRCESYCSQAESQCQSGCASGPGCTSRCGALRSACLAGCQ